MAGEGAQDPGCAGKRRRLRARGLAGTLRERHTVCAEGKHTGCKSVRKQSVCLPFEFAPSVHPGDEDAAGRIWRALPHRARRRGGRFSLVRRGHRARWDTGMGGACPVHASPVSSPVCPGFAARPLLSPLCSQLAARIASGRFRLVGATEPPHFRGHHTRRTTQ
jgi:hypothetical protein